MIYYLCNTTARDPNDKRGILLCAFSGTKKQLVNNMIAWNQQFPNTIIIVGKVFAKKTLRNIHIDLSDGIWKWPLAWPQ